MFNHLGKAFAQLGDPKLNWVIFVSAGVALVLLIGLVVGVGAVVDNTTFFETWPWSWGNWVIRTLGWLGSLIVAWFLFPVLLVIVVSTLLEYVSRAVEAKHYPELPKARDQPFVTEILPELVKFFLVILVVNLIALPFYLIFSIFLGLGFVISWIVNGYLIGREYMEMVAMRRMSPREAKDFRRQNGGKAFVAGVIVAVMMSIPVLNLVAAVIATAFMTHLFEDIRRKAPAMAQRSPA